MGIYQNYASSVWGYGYGYNNISFGYCGGATLMALLVIFVFHSARKLLLPFLYSNRHPVSSAPSTSTARTSQSGTANIASEADLRCLIEYLDDKLSENEKWESVIEKRNDLLSYSAKCCKPKDAPLKYLSTTVFENCSSEILRDFYMDNDYRKQWDKTVIAHDQLQVDTTNGTEIGRTLKKFPLLTPREYILAWRLWEGKDQSFYCFIKECEHSLVPRQKKYVRVEFFRSGWRIRKVPGRDACEIKLFYQEDAGLNVEMAKLAFARGIWSYICKMDIAFHRYSANNHCQIVPAVTAVSLIQKLPPEFERLEVVEDNAATLANTDANGVITGGAKKKKFSKGPSKKALANGLVLVGGAICLSRGNSSLAAKVVLAYILTKLRKHGTSSGQSSGR